MFKNNSTRESQRITFFWIYAKEFYFVIFCFLHVSRFFVFFPSFYPHLFDLFLSRIFFSYFKNMWWRGRGRSITWKRFNFFFTTMRMFFHSHDNTWDIAPIKNWFRQRLRVGTSLKINHHVNHGYYVYIGIGWIFSRGTLLNETMVLRKSRYYKTNNAIQCNSTNYNVSNIKL